MKLSHMRFYGGAREKVCRLDLAPIFWEVQEILLSTDIRVWNRKHAHGAGRIRQQLDAGFAAAADWQKSTAGDIDWNQKIRYDASVLARLGVEIQVSEGIVEVSTEVRAWAQVARLP